MKERTATYKTIREDIVNSIVRGTYEPGALIPQQEVYAEKFGVSRGTVRKAIDELVARGVLITVRGKGTTVADYKQSRHFAERALSFHNAKRVQQQTLVSKVIDIRVLNAEPWLAKQLCISVGAEVVYIRRVRIVKGNPENYQCSYITRSKVAMIDFAKEDLQTGSLFGLLRERAGLAPKFQDEEIRAIRCPEEIAHELRLQKDDPVLLIVRTVFGQDDLPMEYCEDYECTDIKGLKITTYAHSM